MILGIGTDILEIDRIRLMLERHGDAFLSRIYTDAEQAEAAARRDPAPYLAGRWAAKEAFSKALGCGIGERCGWRDINVSGSNSGKPILSCTGAAAATGASLGLQNIHLSISHEKNIVCAMVVLEQGDRA